MERIKIKNTDIFLEDYGDNKGKIIISNTYGYNFSYYWGSMGSNLKDFLLRINEGYFIDKLSTDRQGKFSGKKTVQAIRKAIKNQDGWDIPWYEHMPAQKELRELLKSLEQCDEVNSFYYECEKITDNYWDIHYNRKKRYESEEFTENVKNLLSESHYYFQYVDSNEHIFLKQLFKDLQIELKKN